MFLISCPYCGERAETEFSYGGEAGISRPLDPKALSDAQWADYLFMRSNPKGPHINLLYLSQCCRRWFVFARYTVTYEIAFSYDLQSASNEAES